MKPGPQSAEAEFRFLPSLVHPNEPENGSVEFFVRPHQEELIPPRHGPEHIFVLSGTDQLFQIQLRLRRRRVFRPAGHEPEKNQSNGQGRRYHFHIHHLILSLTYESDTGQKPRDVFTEFGMGGDPPGSGRPGFPPPGACRQTWDRRSYFFRGSGRNRQSFGL